jgi:hypothetical protein
MKPTDSIDLGVTREIQDIRIQGAAPKNFLDKDQEIVSAEQEVQRSISRFEHAMENLAQKAEVTHDKVQHQVQHAQDLIHMPKQKLSQLDDQFANWARLKSYAIEDGIRNFYDKLQFGVRETVYEVRRNPRPYLWSAGIAGLFTGLLFLTSLRNDDVWEENEESDF